VDLVLPPLKPDGLTMSTTGTGNNKRFVATFNDNSIAETSYDLQRSFDGTTWATVGTSPSPLDQPNTHSQRTILDSTSNASASYQYRVVARNKVGYSPEFPTMTASSTSATVGVNPPTAPSALTGALQVGPKVALTWKDNASNETGFVLQRSSDNGVTFSQLATAPARTGSGSTVSFTDSTVALGTTYQYRVASVGVGGQSAWSNVLAVPVMVPVAPAKLLGSAARSGTNERVTLSWGDLSNEAGYTVQWSTSSTFATIAGTGTTAANVTSFTTGNIARQTWYFRVLGSNALGSSPWSNSLLVPAA
jgi:hypothetical protein